MVKQFHYEASCHKYFRIVLSFFFSLNTPPGTKVKLLGTIQVKNGILLLDDSKISVLGGEVDHMVEKWELQRVRAALVMMAQLHLPEKIMELICW